MPFFLWPLLRSFSWQELLHHPWRAAAAVVSVTLGVALAFSVHLINASALNEFAQAARAVGGQPDLVLRAASGGATVPEALYTQLARHPDVVQASPVLEQSTYAVADAVDDRTTTELPVGKRLLRIVGLDALQAARSNPQLMPLPGPGQDRLAVFAPDAVFLNPAARAALPGTHVQLQVGLQLRRMQVAGTVAASGAPLAVMDIAAAQDLLGRQGVLTRVDLQLRAGTDRAALAQALQSAKDWPAGLRLAEPEEALDRMGALSRAYRVNLTVLALVALFTGSFLVFSVLALSVSRRAPQLALLGVLGLTQGQRQRLVLVEAAVLGLLGSAAGIAVGTGLAALALQLLGGDLGGGFFDGSAPALQWSPGAALLFGALGVAAAVVGAWQPARWAQRLPLAQALKNAGNLHGGNTPTRLGLAMLASGALLALLPPVAGIPVAAYLSVGALLLGGIVSLPWLVGPVLDRLPPLLRTSPLPLLAVERARRVRSSAAVAVSGVVASLSLAVALTVMVTSFRDSVAHWLGQVLPADLYVRTGNSGSAIDSAYFDPAFVTAAARLHGVHKLRTQRSQSVLLSPTQPPVALLARSVTDLPLVNDALPVPAGHVGIYVSEAMVDLYGARAGTTFPLLSAHFRAATRMERAQPATFYIAGIWRDYTRQFGAIAMETADFERLSQDLRVNDLALWLAPGTEPSDLQNALQALANQMAHTPSGDAGRLLEFGSAQAIRAMSLKIFDRSFAVTYWLQGVAIGMGLFGVAASFSAQVLARRKEFGLLVHLGLTRRQVLALVALEGAAWTTLGALAGLALGMAVAVVLVSVVNPQSFHWTMELRWPLGRLLALAGAVVAAGTLTAWLAGRSAAGRDAVLAVKEDW